MISNAKKEPPQDCISTLAWQVENHLSQPIEQNVSTDHDSGSLDSQLLFSAVWSRVLMELKYI